MGNWKVLLHRHVPITNWIRGYNLEMGISDLIAGVTISLTMIPQSIAYAALAGQDPQYGLNSAFIGCLIYVFFGTIREVVIGPSSLMSLLTYEYTNELNTDCVIMLTLLSGVVEFFMGVFQLGFLVGFLSAPVVSGFTSASSIVIVCSQLKGLFGLHFKSIGFVDNFHKVLVNLPTLRMGDTVLGISCFVGLLLMRRLKDVKVKDTMPGHKFWNGLFWFLGTARNFFAVTLCTCVSVLYHNTGLEPPFITTKPVDSGIPSIRFPKTTTQIGNNTLGLAEMASELGTGIVVLPIVAILVNVAIAKAFAAGTVDATQEMLTLSLCNVAGSLVQAMPSCGAFTRSAVISASGVRTPMAGLFSAVLTLLALHFLSPYFKFIPRASLAAVLIAAVIFLIDWQILRPLWRTSKLEFYTLLATIVACLGVSIEIGLLFGVVIGLAELVYKWTTPKVTIAEYRTSQGNYLKVTPQLGLFFPSVDYISNLVIRSCQNPDKLPVVIDCSLVQNSDFSTAKAFHTLGTTLEKMGQPLVFVNVNKKCRRKWENAGCRESLFNSTDDIDNILFDEEPDLDIQRKFENEPVQRDN